MRPALKNIVIILLLVICAALLFWRPESGLSLFENDTHTQTGQDPQAVKVLTQPVVYTENTRIFEAVGTGRAKYSADLYPSVDEEVMAVLFEAQQKVKKGDVLVQLDDRNEILAVKLAEVELKDARSLSERYEKAGEEGAVPQSEVDSARAALEGAEVALEQAKLDLEQRKIIAPFDGVVGIPRTDPGERVDPNTLITGLDARDVLYVDFEVPEALAGALREAENNKQTIAFTTPSYSGRTFDGYISAQETRVDPERRTLMARASIENKDDVLRPGMSFTARWSIPGPSFATVPEISVQWSREGSFVWIIRDNKAEKTMARVVARKGGQVLLDGDIKDGESVVIEGLQRLRDGVNVERINHPEEQT
mgnify:FL=1